MHRSIQELGMHRLRVAERIELAVAELERPRAEDDLEPESSIEWQEIGSAARRRWAID